MDAQQQGLLQQVTQWAEIVDEAVRERNMVIRKASKAGLTTRQIGVAAGMGHSTVANMLSGPKELPQGWVREKLLGVGGERVRQVGE
jgi:hypothetical protein